MKEIWKQINNSNYFVSNFGNVKNKFGKCLKPFESSKYLSVNLFLEKNKSKKFYVHRLVAMAFLENPNNKEEVNHIDGNKFNNNINNLEWCTPLENQRHKIDVLKKDNKGKNNPMFGKTGKISPKFKDFILQIKDGIVINKFESTLEAARFLNNGANTNGSSKISICLSKKKYNGRRFLTYKGFKWVFKNEWIQNLANSEEPLTIKDEGNSDPSLI